MAPRTRVVLIHSNSELRNRLASSLTRSGYRVFSAKMRADGLPLIFRVRPAVICLETLVDSEETWETFSRIRLFTDTPVILLADQPLGPTHHLQPDDTVQVIVAPISDAQVLAAAKTILGNRDGRSAAELDRQRERTAPVYAEDVYIREQLTWLNTLLSRIRQTAVPVQAIDESILNHLLTTLNAYSVALYLPAPGQVGWHQALKCDSSEAVEWSAAQVEFVDAWVTQVAETRSMVILDGVTPRMETQDRSDPYDVGLGPVVIVPLIARDQMHGALVLVGHVGAQKSMTLTRIQFIMIVGECLALALDKTRLLKEVRQVAILDESTGVYSQSYLDQAVQAEAERQGRYGRPFSVVRLKWVNSKEYYEAQGYQAYSEMLRQIAQLARAQVRACDVVARGADEGIAFVLPETDLAQAQRVASRLEETIQASLSSCGPEVRPRIATKVFEKPQGSLDGIDLPLKPSDSGTGAQTGIDDPA